MSIGASAIDAYRLEVQVLRTRLCLALLFIVGLGAWVYRLRKTSDEDVTTSVEPTAREENAAELSPKEHEVLTLIGEGESNKGIAGRLFVAESTVKSHVNSIYKKRGLANRREARALARAFAEGDRLSVADANH